MRFFYNTSLDFQTLFLTCGKKYFYSLSIFSICVHCINNVPTNFNKILITTKLLYFTRILLGAQLLLTYLKLCYYIYIYLLIIRTFINKNTTKKISFDYSYIFFQKKMFFFLKKI